MSKNRDTQPRREIAMDSSVSPDEIISITKDGPAEEYHRRLRIRESEIRHLDRLHIRFGNFRLLLAVVTIAFAWFIFHQHRISSWWLILPIAIFIVLVRYHRQVLRARKRTRRIVEIYQRGLARIEDRWAGMGQRGDRFRDPAHLYAADLDLFGRGSLFELLSTARTRMGEDILAEWLLAPSPVNEILERQHAIAELSDNLSLREDVAIQGEETEVGVAPEELLHWAEAPPEIKQTWLRWAAPLLALLAIASTVVWATWGIVIPLLIVLVIEGSLTYGLRKQLLAIFSSTEQGLKNLDLLAGILERLTQEHFHTQRLQTLQQTLTSQTLKASEAIANLRTLVDWIDSRDNWFIRILDVPLMYSVQVALASETWRARHGKAVRGWLEAVGELEALLSLATYHYEHPDDPFPVFQEGESCFIGEALSHPLIASSKCVRNDVQLSTELRAVLVSGSNMSGKSTYLRTVGINTVLALAGAPVRARHLKLTALHIGAIIQINDSLQEGSSRFYAEILRLRRIYDLAAKTPPLLFLLDELLQGTNSKDRRVGAEGVIRGLLERGAIGIMTTHDLALTEMAELPEGMMRNMHFQDEMKDGRMQFDFRLRPGIITKSNGLELMRSIGLKV